MDGIKIVPDWLTPAVYGWAAVVLIVIAVISYFLGCFNGSVIVSKYILRDDVRTHGSGNAGLTNFYRTFGGPLTFVVILTDVLKAVLAVLFGMWAIGALGSSAAVLGKFWAGTFCMLGHVFPCMFHFKGGKAILSGGTIAIMIGIGGGGVLPCWIVPVTVWGGFLLLTLLTRWVSLGSCWAGLSFPFVTWFVFHDLWCTVLAVVCGVLILWKHKENIKRILKGKESKFSLHKKKEEST